MTLLLDVGALRKDFRTGGSWPMRARRVRILDDVTFFLNRGETLGVVGESGSGKSTTGRIVLNLLPANSGSVRYEGQEILGLPERRFRPYRGALQMIFQDPGRSLNPSYRVGRTIDETLRVHRPELGRTERQDAVASLLTQVGLHPMQRLRFPHEFSGGQRQRIGIARALAAGPRLIVADEPVSALDVSVQAQILNLLRDLRDAHGLAYLFIAHDLAVVQQMSDRVAVMYRGRIVETAPSREIYRHPAHPYTRLLLASVPRLDGTAAADDAPPGASGAGEIGGAGCTFAPRCPLADYRCRSERPEAREIAPAHVVACHKAG